MSDQPPSDPYGTPPPPPPPPPSYGSGSSFGSMPPPPPPPPGYGLGQATPGYGADGLGGPMGMQLAEWPIRAGAWLIDFVIMAVAGFIIGVALPDGLSNIVSLAAGIGYYGYMNGVLGQTVGKQVLKIKVVHQETGAVIGLGPAIVRYLIWVVLFVACIIPGVVNALFPLWDKNKQTLHDKAVKSQVVVAS